MDMNEIVKQTIKFNKTTFDNTFSAMTVLQEQAGSVVNNLIDRNTWMPAEGKKATSDWLKSVKQGNEEFKALVDGNYGKVAEAFTSFNTK